MRCLYCYKELQPGQSDFHPACSRKLFGKPEAPALPYTEEDMLELGKKIIRNQVVVTGVQPKLSLEIEEKQKGELPKQERFTIVGLWGNYILKPSTKTYPRLAEVEDLTMHLAEIAGMATVPHSLIRLQDGQPAYITKRIDRIKGKKLHMEDMCQLTGRLTEDKYKGSYEQIAKAILKYSAAPGLDLVNFFEQVIFSFLTGNADMHLKNFSLIKKQEAGYVLAPAYDMVASALLVKGDTEELALHINGKKRKLERKDFDKVMSSFSMMEKKTIENIYKRFSLSIGKWIDFLPMSFLSNEMQVEYLELIKNRAGNLELDYLKI
jgi:serine/threonine-protein kinase HipA